MLNTRRSGLQFVGLLLMFACVMHRNLPASYAQSTSARTKDLYFIIGAVNSPGVYRIESAPSLLKLLALAGGLTDTHGSVAFIMRELPAQAADQDPAFKVIQVRIDELLKGNLEAAANLEPGDIVNIPQADVFYVAGEVIAPGSFPFNEGVTLLQAISAARGVKVGAKADRVIIFRQDQTTGKRQEISVDVDAVKTGKQKDIPFCQMTLSSFRTHRLSVRRGRGSWMLRRCGFSLLAAVRVPVWRGWILVYSNLLTNENSLARPLLSNKLC